MGQFDVHLDLRVDLDLLLGGSSDDGESSDTLTVQSHVLGERLAKEDLVSLLDKVSRSKGVGVNRSRGESLRVLRQKEEGGDRGGRRTW